MTNEPEKSAVEQPPQTPVQFQSKVIYLDGGHELIAHLEAPKVIAGNLLQLLQEEQIIVVNLAHVKKIITKVLKIEPTNGHSRIIV